MRRQNKKKTWKLEDYKKRYEELEEALQKCTVDLTELQNKKDALRESEQKYQLLIENSLQGIVITQDSRIVFCNKAMAGMSGYTVDELLFLSFAEINKMLFINDGESVFQRQQDLLAGKNIPLVYECESMRKDGKRLWLEVCSSVIEYHGRPAIQSVLTDITERKETMEKLQKALCWQNAIFEGSRDAVFISDMDLRFVSVNDAACKLTGYSKDELLHMRVLDLNKSTDPSRLEDLRNHIWGGEEIVGEAEIFHKNGQRIDAEFAHLRLNVNGTQYIHTSARDITSQKQLEAQLMQAQKMEALGVLAGGVAHDFNNLLTIINGYCKLLLDETTQNDPKREDLEEIYKAGHRATTLTSQLLAFSRKQKLNPVVLNLNEEVENASKMLRRLIGEDIELSTVLQPDLKTVNADPGLIQQIIVNLAVNARDAMPQGGRLSIETANVYLDREFAKKHPYDVKTGSYTMLSVSDSGIGMDEITRKRIFEPFFTTKESKKGTGLGLSTVYGIVKQSNGYICVCSEQERGTTFKIYFPHTKDKIEKPIDYGNAEHGKACSETILVVEDDPTIQDLTHRILGKEGYNILKATSPKDALTIVQDFSSKIDLILTDVVMPEMSGSELVSRINTICPSIKTLYMSGYTDDTIVNHGILKTNTTFIQKPFTGNNLSTKVRDVLYSGNSN